MKKLKRKRAKLERVILQLKYSKDENKGKFFGNDGTKTIELLTEERMKVYEEISRGSCRVTRTVEVAIARSTSMMK